MKKLMALEFFIIFVFGMLLINYNGFEYFASVMFIVFVSVLADIYLINEDNYPKVLAAAF